MLARSAYAKEEILIINRALLTERFYVLPARDLALSSARSWTGDGVGVGSSCDHL